MNDRAKTILKIILDKLMLLCIALVILGGVAWIALYFADANIREIDRKNKADPIYQKVMAESAEKEKVEKERQKKLDAEVEIFIYQTENMIITAELQVSSSWREPENGEDGNSSVGFYYRKDFIKNNF